MAISKSNSTEHILMLSFHLIFSPLRYHILKHFRVKILYTFIYCFPPPTKPGNTNMHFTYPTRSPCQHSAIWRTNKLNSTPINLQNSSDFQENKVQAVSSPHLFNTIFLKELKVAQPVKKFPNIYEMPRFTIKATGHKWTLSLIN